MIKSFHFPKPQATMFMRLLILVFILFSTGSRAQETPEDTSSVTIPTNNQNNDGYNSGASTGKQNKSRPDIVETDASSNVANTNIESLSRHLTSQMQNPKVLYDKAFDSFMPFFLAIFIVIFGFGIYLLYTTAICKDLSYDPQTQLLRPVPQRPFSYSKFQLFWWTLIVLTCFIAFYIYSGVLLAFNSTVVLLLGGGLGVSLLGKVIDNTQIENNNTPVPVRHQDLGRTKGLLEDILSEEGGFSIHRFQAFMFNLIFGIAFIVSFYKGVIAKIFPFIEFEFWQLSLLGVSAAGFLALKSKENPPETKTERQVEAVTNSYAISDNIKNPELEVAHTDQKGITKAFDDLKIRLVKNGLLQQQ